MRVARCSGCGRLSFPPRLWCPHCGRDAWEPAEVREGVVETATVTRDGDRVATVVLDGGPPVLVATDARPGERVEL